METNEGKISLVMKNGEVFKTLAELEKEAIFETLRVTKNNKVLAAKLLDVSVKTLYNKLNKYFNSNLKTLEETTTTQGEDL